MWRWCLLTLLSVGVFGSSDLIENLPGMPSSVKFKQYSGYISVNTSWTPARHYHYWLAEATKDADSAPLMLWLNGGPGCSSLMGLFTENGPFRVNDDGGLDVHPLAWNELANVVYLESPAPVGFSYGGDGVMGDNRTMHDNYEFLQGFFQKFPQYKSRPFFISGESYAGQYIPQLANKILDENDEGKSPHINLHGFIVGNPSGLSSKSWNVSYYEFMMQHGFISEDEVASIAEACNYTEATANENCTMAQQAAFNNNFKGVDPYNILAPCLGDGPGMHPGCFTARNLETSEFQRHSLNLEQTFVPCTTFNKTLAYLNRPDVKSALHVSPDAYAWTPCSQHLTYDQYQPGTPDLYRKMAGRIRMLVYSGDVDSCVPFVGTRLGVRSLGLKPTSSYRQWHVYDPSPGVQSEQIAGYTIDYDGVSFCTIRGAGHMVPRDKPIQALAMLDHFLQGHPL